MAKKNQRLIAVEAAANDLLNTVRDQVDCLRAIGGKAGAVRLVAALLDDITDACNRANAVLNTNPTFIADAPAPPKRRGRPAKAKAESVENWEPATAEGVSV